MMMIFRNSISEKKSNAQKARCKIFEQGINDYDVNAKFCTVGSRREISVIQYGLAPTLTFPTDTLGLNLVLQSLHHFYSLPLASLADKHDGTYVCTRR